MNNVLRNTLIYTGVYFLYCMAVFLVLVTIQLFWKPIVFMFCVILALLTADHYTAGKWYPDPAEVWALIRAKTTS